jgi:hypothetical protein
MFRSPHRRRILAAAVAALTLATVAPPPAVSAAGPATGSPASATGPAADSVAGSAASAAGSAAVPQGEVDAYLAGHPGGVQVSATEISYDNGRFIVSVAPLGDLVAGTPDCPRGWFCVYEYTGFRYPRGQFSDCGWQDLTRYNWHNRAASVHYNAATGYVVFYAHVGGISHTADVALFSLDTGFRADADVSPYRDVADHVRRFC